MKCRVQSRWIICAPESRRWSHGVAWLQPLHHIQKSTELMVIGWYFIHGLSRSIVDFFINDEEIHICLWALSSMLCKRIFIVSTPHDTAEVEAHHCYHYGEEVNSFGEGNECKLGEENGGCKQINSLLSLQYFNRTRWWYWLQLIIRGWHIP